MAQVVDLTKDYSFGILLPNQTYNRFVKQESPLDKTTNYTGEYWGIRVVRPSFDPERVTLWKCLIKPIEITRHKSQSGTCYPLVYSKGSTLEPLSFSKTNYLDTSNEDKESPVYFNLKELSDLERNAINVFEANMKGVSGAAFVGAAAAIFFAAMYVEALCVDFTTTLTAACTLATPILNANSMRAIIGMSILYEMLLDEAVEQTTAVSVRAMAALSAKMPNMSLTPMNIQKTGVLSLGEATFEQYIKNFNKILTMSRQMFKGVNALVVKKGWDSSDPGYLRIKSEFRDDSWIYQK